MKLPISGNCYMVFAIAPFVWPNTERLFLIRLAVKFIAKTCMWRFDKNGFARIQLSTPDPITLVTTRLAKVTIRIARVSQASTDISYSFSSDHWPNPIDKKRLSEPARNMHSDQPCNHHQIKQTYNGLQD